MPDDMHHGSDGTGRSVFASETDGWTPIIPEITTAEANALAGADNAKERIGEIAGNRFDAANSCVEASEGLEEAHRYAASRERAHLERIYKERDAQPETHAVASTEKVCKPCGWTGFSGWLSVTSLGVLMIPVPVVVSMGIAQSFAFEAVADDWRLGIPFGLPVLGGILASSLLRQTLTHGARDAYDRIVSVGGLAALAGWAGSYAYTFLAPLDMSGGFGGSGGGGDLRIFYGAHLALEVAAGLGLAAMAERGFTAGRKIVAVANGAIDLLTKRAALVMQRWLGHVLEADTVKDRRLRLAAARADYIETCLADLKQAEARRSAAVAHAAATFGNPASQ